MKEIHWIQSSKIRNSFRSKHVSLLRPIWWKTKTAMTRRHHQKRALPLQASMAACATCAATKTQRRTDQLSARPRDRSLFIGRRRLLIAGRRPWHRWDSRRRAKITAESSAETSAIASPSSAFRPCPVHFWRGPSPRKLLSLMNYVDVFFP